MRIPWIAAACLAALPATAALAEDDCHAPRAAWQPREAAMQAASRLGWRVEEIEADDGCWEIEGRDAEGRRIKAKLAPATLNVVKLRHRDGGRDRRREDVRAPAAPLAPPPANPLFQNGKPPVVQVN